MAGELIWLPENGAEFPDQTNCVATGALGLVQSVWVLWRQIGIICSETVHTLQNLLSEVFSSVFR